MESIFISVLSSNILSIIMLSTLFFIMLLILLAPNILYFDSSIISFIILLLIFIFISLYFSFNFVSSFSIIILILSLVRLLKYIISSIRFTNEALNISFNSFGIFSYSLLNPILFLSFPIFVVLLDLFLI